MNGQSWLLPSEHLEETPVCSVLFAAEAQPSDALAPQSCPGRLGREVHGPLDQRVSCDPLDHPERDKVMIHAPIGSHVVVLQIEER